MTKNKNKNTDQTNDAPAKALKSGKTRRVSKKAYFARNANGAISKKNKMRRFASAAKRKAYWNGPDGQARKDAKMNTPEKIKARAAAKVARASRRRERQLAEQKAAREQTLQNEKAN